MISGFINARREALVPLSIQDVDGRIHEVEAVVDTGFNGFLTLPSSTLESLGLARAARGQIFLADGSEGVFDIFLVTIIWDGQSQIVETDAVGTTPLTGMSLLQGFELRLKVVEGGAVTITSLI